MLLWLKQDRFSKDLRRGLRKVRKAAEAVPVQHCPICGYEGQFGPYGVPLRLSANCPSCRSKERHRHFKLWLDRSQAIAPSDKVLHFAPEPAIARVVKPICAV